MIPGQIEEAQAEIGRAERALLDLRTRADYEFGAFPITGPALREHAAEAEAFPPATPHAPKRTASS